MENQSIIGARRTYSPQECIDYRMLMRACHDPTRGEQDGWKVEALWRLLTDDVAATREYDQTLWFLTVCRMCCHLTHDCTCHNNTDRRRRPAHIRLDARKENWLVLKVSIRSRLPLIMQLIQQRKLESIGSDIAARLKTWVENDFKRKGGA